MAEVSTWQSEDDYTDWLNGLVENSDDRIWDKDEAQEAIVTEYVGALEAVAEAARAEALAQGYRSSDMAHALQALYGEFWFETFVPPEPSIGRCAWSVTADMDDGPLTQRCVLTPHGADIEHRFGGEHGE